MAGLHPRACHARAGRPRHHRSGTGLSLPLWAGDGVTTLSDHLLNALGFPREQIAARREGSARSQNLTFSDPYAYVYLQAREIDRQVVGHLDS
ncbi:hypothetical protein [Streptomyces canus]|uniref:hypothetical protein n=1 Tax=Streptomyces canus TaxID=58343 RepID=UPI00037BA4BD|nr:hypothetical protein [Streptomyces canus]